MTGPQDDATRPAWRFPFRPRRTLPPGFFQRDVRAVARDLLGTVLVSEIGGAHASGVVVETEAYLGGEDPASHAATRVGRTTRNAAMFGPAGHAYVYLIYGMHWCLHVVTGEEGDPQAVLVRGLEPLTGLEPRRRRRGRRTDLGSGPGRLCQALGVDGEMYGHDLTRPPLCILPGWHVPDEEVSRTGRIGVRHAADWPYRWLVRGSPGVSPGRPAPASAEP